MTATTQTNPNDPPPQEDPTHDVPVYPEKDPPPGDERAIKAAGKPGPLRAREGDEGGPPNPGLPSKGKDEGHDVDDDDLDPKAPHSPPDVGRGRVIFDESKVVS